jgi:hypothetical protein
MQKFGEPQQAKLSKSESVSEALALLEVALDLLDAADASLAARARLGEVIELLEENR